MVMHMMLAHMCEEPYWLLRKTFSIQLAVSALLVAGIVPLVSLYLQCLVFFKVVIDTFTFFFARVTRRLS